MKSSFGNFGSAKFDNDWPLSGAKTAMMMKK